MDLVRSVRQAAPFLGGDAGSREVRPRMATRPGLDGADADVTRVNGFLGYSLGILARLALWGHGLFAPRAPAVSWLVGDLDEERWRTPMDGGLWPFEILMPPDDAWVPGLALMPSPRCGGHVRASADPSVAPVDGLPGALVAQVRGVLAERVIVSTLLDPFLPLKALAAYSGLSVRTLRGYLSDPIHPLPCYRIGSKILVRRSEFDAWIATYRAHGRADIDQVVADVLEGLV
jgi:Helix-turn-helix domain